MVFGGFLIDHAISTGADALQFTRSSHSRESLAVDTECLSITRPDECARTRKSEEARSSLMGMWYSATRHKQV